MLASVGWNILRPIWVSLKKRENIAYVPLASSTLSHLLLCGVAVAAVLGQRRHACVAIGGDPGMGGSCRCGGHLHHGGTCYIDFCSGGYYGVG
jgi:hypothetical protein